MMFYERSFVRSIAWLGFWFLLMCILVRGGGKFVVYFLF